MPRLRRTQKEYERLVICDFLRSMGYSVSRPVWRERPDAVLTVRRGGIVTRVGIEHTDYYADTCPGQPSPGADLVALWDEVQTSLARRIGQRKSLAHTTGLVTLKAQRPPFPHKAQQRTLVARELAADLVQVALANSLAAGEERLITTWPTACGILGRYVKRIRLWQRDSSLRFDPRFNWRCANASAARVGIVVPYVVEAVARKTAKARSYNWGAIDERWLLLTAGAKTVFQGGGRHPDHVNWSQAGLRSTCAKSGFDRIFVWEHVHRWCKPLWPEGPVVRQPARR